MKAALGLVLGLALVGCSDGGEGSGEDSLPKRGENTTDPTIVAATANCESDGDGAPGIPAVVNLAVRVTATDAAGQENLGNCVGATAASTDDGSFGSGSAGTCYLRFSIACTKQTPYVVDLTVSNATGGVTTASVTVRPD
jgi:hypothetical protein